MSEYDPPESWYDYFQRKVEPMIPANGDWEDRQWYLRIAKPNWEKQEKEKVAYAKRLVDEAKVHEREVEKLTTKIERENGRVRRETERVQRDAQRKREQELEREKRDPTAIIQSEGHPVPIPYSIRDQHIYVPGGTRRGKTTLLLNMIMNDIINNQGVAVLDPKGGLINKICGLMPEERINDCIYIDLESSAIPLDFMGHRKNEVETTIGELVFIITKDDANLTAAGPMLKRAIRTLLSVPRTTFLDIRKFFTDKTRQGQILDVLELVNRELWQSWQPMPKEPEYRAIVTRMDNFYWNPALQIIFGSPSARLKIDEVMDEGKILLVNLHPITNTDNRLFGSLIVSKFQQAIMRRGHIAAEDQIPFFLYVDEFECFQTASFATIFSMAGGLGLRLTLGNQYIDQLTSDIRSAVIGNTGTYIIFQLGALDYSLFKTVTHPYDPAWLTRLEPHQAMFKVGSQPPVFKWTKNSKPFEKARADSVLQKIKDQTLDQYGPEPDTSAEYSQKRTEDNASCNPPPIRQDVRNEHRTASAEKPEVQPGSAPINIPPHENKT